MLGLNPLRRITKPLVNMMSLNPPPGGIFFFSKVYCNYHPQKKKMPGVPGGAQAASALLSGTEKAANTVLTDDYTNPTANEGNLLSLITLNQILGADDQADAKGVARKNVLNGSRGN